MKNTLFLLSYLRISQLLLGGLGLSWLAQPSLAAPSQYLQVTVNSDRDNLQPDAALTLREAISIVNGTLPLDRLSPEERQLVTPSTDCHLIQFKLTLGKSRIVLNAELPAIVTPKVTIDGGAVPSKVSIQNLRFARPGVEIVPAPEAQINRGLSLIDRKSVV